MCVCVCVCVHACVCFRQVKPAIGEGCVYIAQSLRAAIGCFKAEKQRNGNSRRCKRGIFHGVIVTASDMHVKNICDNKCIIICYVIVPACVKEKAVIMNEMFDIVQCK